MKCEYHAVSDARMEATIVPAARKPGPRMMLPENAEDAWDAEQYSQSLTLNVDLVDPVPMEALLNRATLCVAFHPCASMRVSGDAQVGIVCANTLGCAGALHDARGLCVGVVPDELDGREERRRRGGSLVEILSEARARRQPLRSAARS